jgi:fructokinase
MAPMIVVAGEALIDLLIHPDGRIVAVPGGGPFNTARTIGRLGEAVAYLGCLSTDRFGAGLREALMRDGVDLSLAVSTDRSTTLAIAELDERGAAAYRFHTVDTSAPGLTEGAVAAAFATRPRAIHLGTLGLVLEPMAIALTVGVADADPQALVMLDPNCRPQVIPDRATYLDRLGSVMARADVVKVSADDLAYLAPGTTAIEAARSLLDRGPSVVILTDGGRAAVVLTGAGALEIAVPSVEVVDTVGAGDVFGGAFLGRWVERGLGRLELGDPAALRDAVAFAVEVATLTCRRSGADPPRRTELPAPFGERVG